MLNVDKNHLQIIRNILNKHIPENEIWAFGSRVTGTAKKYSDLDLAIISNTPTPTLTIALLKEEFSKSDLPYKIDLVDWATIEDSFKEIIRKKHQTINT